MNLCSWSMTATMWSILHVGTAVKRIGDRNAKRIELWVITVGMTSMDTKEIEKELQTIKSFEVVDISHVMEAADRLQEIKQFGEKLTERKEQITKPIKEALKSATDLFKPFEKKTEEIEKELKTQVLAWHQRQWKSGEISPNTIEGSRGKVTVVAKRSVNIVDKKKLPKEYWVLTPNIEMIEAALKAGNEVKGAELVENYTIASGKL